MISPPVVAVLPAFWSILHRVLFPGILRTLSAKAMSEIMAYFLAWLCHSLGGLGLSTAIHSWPARLLVAASGFAPLSFDKPSSLVPGSGLELSFWFLWSKEFLGWIPRPEF